MPTPDVRAAWSCLDGSARPGATSSAKVTRLDAPTGVFYLKERPNAERALLELELVEFLSSIGLPVPRPIACADGRNCATEGTSVFWLSRELPGAHLELPSGSVGLAHAGLIGRALARLHRTLAAAASARSFPVFASSAEDQIDRLLARATPFDAHRLTQLRRGLHSDTSLPQQLIHRDPHRLNLLFRRERVTGYLDFDFVLQAPRLFDLCYCMTGILSERFPVSGYAEHWLSMAHALVRSYRDEIDLSSRELSAAWSMLATVQLIFMSYCWAGGNLPAALMNQNILFWMDDHRAELESAFE